MLGAIYPRSLVRGILDRLLPVKQVQELSRAEIEVSCCAGGMAIPLMGLSSHSFLIRTSDGNIKMESNSRITGFPAEGTVTITLYRTLCCNPMCRGGYDRGIPAETHSSSYLCRTHACKSQQRLCELPALRED